VLLGPSGAGREGLQGTLAQVLEESGVEARFFRTAGREPTVNDVDALATDVRACGADVVISAGGGSVMDAGKAVAALATAGAAALDYLEGTGPGRTLERPPLPHLAVPTTAGTGTEVTRNAVLAVPGRRIKRSMRSPQLVPETAILDPELVMSLPPAQTAASGMDALTQLVESCVSRKAQPIPGALALLGVELAGRSLLSSYRDGSNLQAREDMLLAACLSGMCLANSGLGLAHGLAAALGPAYGIPHGLACAILLPVSVRVNRVARTPSYARVAESLLRRSFPNPEAAVDALEDEIARLLSEMGMPRDLKGFGIPPGDVPEMARNSRGSSLSGNPVELTDGELDTLLRALV